MVEAIEDGNETAGDGTTRLVYTDRLGSISVTKNSTNGIWTKREN
jgi:hypothetical protein